MKIRTKAPNVALTKELNENTNKSTKFWFQYLAGLYFIVVHFRTFVTGGQVSQSLVEAIVLRLTGEAVTQIRAKGPESPYLSKWKVVVLRVH
jgi:hypothetical protein